MNKERQYEQFFTMSVRDRLSDGQIDRYVKSLYAEEGFHRVYEAAKKKKMLPFVGTPPFLATLSGLMRTSASFLKPPKSFIACLASVLRSARKRMRGRVPVCFRFQRVWNSFHAIWKAMNVLPVPVASVSRMRRSPLAIPSSTCLTAVS